MKQFRSLLVVGLMLQLAVSVQGDAAYKGETETIKTAQIIAIVEISATEKVSVQGKYWNYGQKATAKTEKVLKGELGENAAFYGDENFICAQCHFEVGRFLVFLDRDGELLTGNNWHLSARKISGETVEWFDNKNFFQPKIAPLFEVEEEISRVIANTKESEPKKAEK
ncbi:MAG TPA: hypothetical protein VGB45_10320 [Abditibacterium sp.]